MPNSPTVETARNDLTVETARWVMRPQPTNIGLYFIYDKITNQVIADGLRRVVAEQQLALLEKLAAESAKPTLAAVELFPLLRAAPHRWGNGLVHRFDDEKNQTWCGKTLDRCPGTKTLGKHEQITCKLCLRSIEARAKAEESRRECDRLMRERERQHAENRRLWWQAYNAYLLTDTWRGKRALVLRRAAGCCEGCGQQRAVQVHHRGYPRDCQPGSKEWIALEKLFDLVAICTECHDDLHRRSR